MGTAGALLRELPLLPRGDRQLVHQPLATPRRLFSTPLHRGHSWAHTAGSSARTHSGHQGRVLMREAFGVPFDPIPHSKDSPSSALECGLGGSEPPAALMFTCVCPTPSLSLQAPVPDIPA